MDHHLFSATMFSESNGAAAAYDAMSIDPHNNNSYQLPGGSAQSDALHGSATAGTAAVPAAAKRKRGRPRKYVPSNNHVVTSPAVSSTSVVKPSSGRAFPATHAAARVPAADAAKRAWVRSPNSNKKQNMEAALGSAGAQMKVHILSVPSGEEISSKILAFTQQVAKAVTILSVTGTISNATLCQSASSGGTVTYEGPFVILTLSGSFLLSQHDGQRGRKGSMSALLASPDGCVVGGIVAGPIIAASPVEVVLGSFHAEEKKMQDQVYCIEPVS